MIQSMSFLVLGAFEPELEPIRKASGAQSSMTPPLTFATTGVGMVEAALGASKVLFGLQGKGLLPSVRVIFVGTIGSVDRNVPLFSSVSASRVVLADVGIVSGKSYYPEAIRKELKSDTAFQATLTRMNLEAWVSEAVYTPPSITTDLSLGKSFQRVTGARFENLELFGIASACAQFGVPWNSLSVVTNYVGASAHQEWQENFRHASEITASVVSEFLCRLRM